MIDKELLRTYADDIGVSLSDSQLAHFDAYAELLVEWNEKMNLTGITDPYGIVVRHFVDSLTAAPLIPKDASLIDVGTGAGFPAIPLAIARPDLQVTLLDSLNKRLVFLDHVCKTIDRPCTIVHARAEDGGRKPELRDSFDVAIARAVAALPTLCEYCLPFVKPGGLFIAMKGPESDNEMDGASSAEAVLAARMADTVSLTVPAKPQAEEDVLSRRLITIKKIGNTPKAYPRPPAKIAKKPLG